MSDTAVDVTMDAREPIRPELPDGVNEAQFNRIVDERVRAGVDEARAQFSADSEKAAKAAAKDSAIGTMRAMIEGNPGDDTASLQFRSAVQDLVLDCMQNEEKPPAEFVAEAVKLNQARLQTLLERGGDGGEVAPQLAQRGAEPPRHFMTEFMGDLASHILDKGDIQGDNLSGTETFEHVKALFDKSAYAKDQFAALAANAGDKGRVIPVPMAALFDFPADARFAETYGTGPDTRREHTYRRDALVDFHRPSNVLGILGAPMLTIDNDLTLPRLSDSMAAEWLAENAEASDDSLVVAVQQTAPHRLATHNQLSWMLLAAGDAQFGHQPLVISEMAAAVMQAKEKAVYQGAATGEDPTGIQNVSGVTTTALSTTDPTYADLLAALQRLTDHNIDVGNARWAINWTMATLLWQIRRFATGSATLLNEAAFMAPGAGPMDAGEYGAVAGMMPGGKLAAVTNHLTHAANVHPMICGVWNFVWCLDYSMLFLTVDDISNARNGRTLITVNSYHDVAVRWTDAFEIVSHDTT